MSHNAEQRLRTCPQTPPKSLRALLHRLPYATNTVRHKQTTLAGFVKGFNPRPSLPTSEEDDTVLNIQTRPIETFGDLLEAYPELSVLKDAAVYNSVVANLSLADRAAAKAERKRSVNRLHANKSKRNAGKRVDEWKRAGKKHADLLISKIIDLRHVIQTATEKSDPASNVGMYLAGVQRTDLDALVAETKAVFVP